ncbi:MAG: SEC-C metal-binding domain-containing protein [Pseudonocardiaceae bacterium]
MSTKSATELCAQAQELEQDAVRYPDERGEILLEAADKWERAGQLDQAVALLREVLTLGGKDAQFARHSLADLYFTQGADSDAWEQLRALEEMEPASTGPASLVAEMLESRGEYEAALHWFDRAIETVDIEEITKPGAGPSLSAMPLLGRQRCRAKLGLPVDKLDRAADIAEDNRREFVDLLDRFAANRATPAAPVFAADPTSAVEVLVWQRAELQLAMQRWPAVFAADAVNDFADIERRLRELPQKQKPARISLILGSVDGFADYVDRTGGDPAEESVRLAYAKQAREQGQMISWPPGRNQRCWCGSERKYKKCCGAPATAR